MGGVIDPWLVAGSSLYWAAVVFSFAFDGVSISPAAEPFSAVLAYVSCGAHGSDDACATCGAGCASDTTQPQVDAVTSTSLSHIIRPDGMPQSAREPMRPNLLAYRRKLSTPEWAEVLNRLEAMRIQVATALGDASPYERDLAALRSRASSLIGQFRGANARYRYAKAVTLHERCDGVIEAASMYENVDLVLRLREQALGLEPPILHLSFDGTLDGSPAEKLRTYLYYL